MNPTINSTAAKIAHTAINTMTLEELREVIVAAKNKIDEKAEQHRITIEQAIADALADGFDVGFWIEGKKDGCFIDHEETNSITHVSVNQWETTNFLSKCKLDGTYNLIHQQLT